MEPSGALQTRQTRLTLLLGIRLPLPILPFRPQMVTGGVCLIDVTSEHEETGSLSCLLSHRCSLLFTYGKFLAGSTTTISEANMVGLNP